MATNRKTRPLHWRVMHFHVALQGHEEDFWRDISLLSKDSVADLAAAVLAAFETNANHLWNIILGKEHFEYILAEELPSPEKGMELVNPEQRTVGSLEWKDGARMEYDYGIPWKFVIKLVSQRDADLERDAPPVFPKLLKGKGNRILEDVPWDTFEELVDMQKHGMEVWQNTDVCEMLHACDLSWDHACFEHERDAMRDFVSRAATIALGYNLAQSM